MSVVVLALVAAFVLIFRLTARVRQLEQQIVRLISTGRTSAPIPPETGVSRRDVIAPARPSAPVPPVPSVPSVPSASPPVPVVERPVPRPEPRRTAEVAPLPVAKPKEEKPAAAEPPRPHPAPVRKGLSINFEDLFGRRLPIWAGGITLAIAGVLIVRYAIDLGLLRIFTPAVRVVCGLMFGLGLIGGAEAARRQAARVDDPRVAQALSGAGIATLYAAILVAANVYHLVGAGVAFAGLAAVTAAALGLSLRFGAPSAVLGLVGGLAAPALVGVAQPNVPLLSVYLALTIAGLAGVSRMQRWAWLGVLALFGGAGWSLSTVLLGGALDGLSTLSLGSLVLLLALALPLLVFEGQRAAALRAISAMLGAAQLALLVALGGFAMLNWGLFALIAAAGQWFAWRNRDFALVPTITLALSVLLLGLWPVPALGNFALVGLALAAVHGGPLLWRLWQAPPSVQRAIELAALALAILVVPLIHFYAPPREASLALLALAATLIPATGIATSWRRADRLGDARFAWLATAVVVLACSAAALALAPWSLPVAGAAIAVAALMFGHASRDPRIEPIARVTLAAALAALTLDGTVLAEAWRLIAGSKGIVDGHAFLRWGALGTAFAMFAWRGQRSATRGAALVVAGALAYGLLAQLLAGWLLPLGLGAVAVAMLFIGRQRGSVQEPRFAALFLAATLPLLMVTVGSGLQEWLRPFGLGHGADPYAALRCAGVALAFAMFAWRSPDRGVASTAQAVAAALGYAAVAQMVPTALLPLVAPLGLAALASVSRNLPTNTLVPAGTTVFAILFGWALIPTAVWTRGALGAVGGVPMMFDGHVLNAALTIKQLLLPALIGGGALWVARDRASVHVIRLAAVVLAAFSLVAVHILYRFGFAAAFGTDFVATGVAQRLVWEVLLIGGGALLAWRGRWHRTAVGLVGTGTPHALWFGLILHNPLWSTQAVGALPLANLLVPLIAVPAGGAVMLRRILPTLATRTARPVQFATMGASALLAWGLLRQAFHGAILVAPGVSPVEDILRSVLAIALATGFLLWGIRAQQRDWRLVSLVLILGAVGKVFLFDASGLTGLLRIGSFVVLGFSLIGIGWLYSRQLRRDAATPEPRPVTA